MNDFPASFFRFLTNQLTKFLMRLRVGSGDLARAGAVHWLRAPRSCSGSPITVLSRDEGEQECSLSPVALGGGATATPPPRDAGDFWGHFGFHRAEGDGSGDIVGESSKVGTYFSTHRTGCHNERSRASPRWRNPDPSYQAAVLRVKYALSVLCRWPWRGSELKNSMNEQSKQNFSPHALTTTPR